MLNFTKEPRQRFSDLIASVNRNLKESELTDKQISDLCHTSIEFVRRQRKFLTTLKHSETLHIEKDDMSKYNISAEDIRREYIENGKGLTECAKIFGCSIGVIRRKMAKHNIASRTAGRPIIDVSAEDIRREYIENGKTLGECAKIFGCSYGALKAKMIAYGVDTRPPGKAPRKVKETETEARNASPPPKLNGNEQKTRALPKPVQGQKRYWERLILLSICQDKPIEDLIQEALELLFEKHRKR